MLDEIFLKDSMFDNFKAKSWSDALDKRDLVRAKESTEIEEENLDSVLKHATGFANLWIDAYYTDIGFDYGLLSFEINSWGSDGLDLRYYEIEFERNGKPYQTIYLTLHRYPDNEWGIEIVDIK